MMRYVLAVLLLVPALWLKPAFAQQPPADLVLGQRLELQSKSLDQVRRYLLYLPPSYESSAVTGRRFPVIYLLDGGAHFNAATGIVHHLSSPNSAVGRMPESIVVALPNMGRTHNMTPTHVTSGPYSEDSGGAADFMAFFRNELIPEIDAKLRTTSERTLVGHSLAGLFALHVFVKEPALFDHYIAIDPSLWWDNQLLVRQLADLPLRDYSGAKSVFIVQANSPRSDYSDIALQKQHESGIRKFRDLLARHQSRGLRVGYVFLADETHLSSPLIGIYRGLVFTYR